MPRTARWKEDKVKNGILNVTLTSWKYFHDYIQEGLIKTKNYVFRGQSNELWKLEPTLNRHFNSIVKGDFKQISESHLENFKYSIRGRTSNLKEIINNDDELWALGQHHGLYTPLLDFTFSPYVAAYFAFYELQTTSKYRTIYGLSQYAIKNQIKNELNIYRPLSDHNPRLLSQGGLFIKFDTNQDIETLFTKEFEDEEIQYKLIKIKIPDKDRETCLKFLNRMNINHNTLFPDTTGASIFCNTELGIKNY